MGASRNGAVALAALLAVSVALAQSWGDHLVRCVKASNDDGTTTTCLCTSSDRLWHDTDCDRTIDAGENYVVLGPIVSTDNTVPRYDGTAGAQQTSGVTVDDSNNVTGVVALTTTGKVTVGTEAEIDGALNHDGTTVGLFGVAPATRPSTTAEIKAALTTMGLLQDGSATDLNLDNGIMTAGEARIPDDYSTPDYLFIRFDESRAPIGFRLDSSGNASYPSGLGVYGADYIRMDPTSGAAGASIFVKPFNATGGGAYSGTNVTSFTGTDVWLDTGSYLLLKNTDSISAAGTVIGTATQLACQHCAISTVAAGATGVKLPDMCPGGVGGGSPWLSIVNRDSADAAEVYPPDATADISGGAGASITLAAGSVIYCFCYDADGDDTWACFTATRATT